MFRSVRAKLQDCYCSVTVDGASMTAGLCGTPAMRFCSTGELAGKGMAGACRVAAAEDPATPEASTAIPDPQSSAILLRKGRPQSLQL